MRLLPLLLLVLLATPTVVDAQPPGGRGGFGPFEQNQITAFLQVADSLSLELSVDQTADLEARGDALDDEIAPQEEAIANLMQRGPDPSTFQEMQPLMAAIQEANEDALASIQEDGVLSENQWSAVQAYLASRAPGGRGRRGGGPG